MPSQTSVCVFTLLSDGSSDRALIRILEWLVKQIRPSLEFRIVWADLRAHPTPPQKLRERIELAFREFPCDILFIHRDAETKSLAARIHGIERALPSLTNPDGRPAPTVCVVPVRMQEAWFLFDEPAIRRAAGNPRGSVALNMPRVADIEDISDPKKLLYDLLTTARDATGRRKKKFSPRVAVHRLAELIGDYLPLRHLPAFQRPEADLRTMLDRCFSATGTAWYYHGD